MKGPLFYAKILLFGEYGIIKDSKGLSIPYNAAKGSLIIPAPGEATQPASNQSLQGFLGHLKSLVASDGLSFSFDLECLEADIQAGLYFDSSIPQGYGIGSSGALVAAIYDNYATQKITVLENLTREKLLRLKELFGKMESYFHGKSSGLDPLNSYLSLPILIHAQDHIASTAIPSQFSAGKGAVFLIDSGQVGETAPMVQLFMEQMKQEGFRNMLKEQFIKHTDACVEDFVSGNIGSLFSNMRQLSKVVLDHFKPMIPAEFHSLWQQGLATNDYYLKLCGSGGGGYILGFTEDLEKAKKALSSYKLEVVYNF
ncbi:MAG: mevalonate kinase [Flavobacteriaceae bacterium]